MSIFKNYFLNIIIIITTILFPMITFPYISRILMPEYLGKVAFAQSIATYFITGALLGLPIYSIRELSKYRNDSDTFKKIFTELFLIGVFGSCFSFIIFQVLIRNIIQLKEYKNILDIFSFQIIFSFLNIDYIFIVLESHKRRVLRNIILRVISLLLIYLIVKNESDYLKYVSIVTFPELIMRLIDLYSVRKYIKITKDIFIKKHLKTILILFVTTVSINLYDQIDTTMLGIILNNQAVGLYSSAVKMTRILIPIIGSLSTVIGPQLIRDIKEKNKNELFKKIDIFLDFNFFIGIQMVFLLFILSSDLIFLFSGEDYLGASLTMKVISPIIFFISIGNFMGGRILTSNNLEKKALKYNLIALLLNILMNLYFIPNYGYLGAGISTVLTEGINCILKVRSVKKIYLEYRILTKNRISYLVLGFSITSLLLILKLYFINYTGFYIILLIGGLYVFLYIIVLLLLGDEIVKKYLKLILKFQ